MANHGTMVWNYLLEVLRRQPDFPEYHLGQLLLGPLLVIFTIRLCRIASTPIAQRSYENATWILHHRIVHYSYIMVHDHFVEEPADHLLDELQDFGEASLDDPMSAIRECGVLIVVGSVLQSEWICSVHTATSNGWISLICILMLAWLVYSCSPKNLVNYAGFLHNLL